MIDALCTEAWLLVGITRNVQILELRNGQLAFTSEEGCIFNVPLLHCEGRKFPWHYFGGGVNSASVPTGDADSAVGGADHTGQADAEVYEMDWAVHEEKLADYQADNVASAAEDGNFEPTEMYAASAVDHQAAADHHGNLGEHGGEMAVYDPSSEVTSLLASRFIFSSH